MNIIQAWLGPGAKMLPTMVFLSPLLGSVFLSASVLSSVSRTDKDGFISKQISLLEILAKAHIWLSLESLDHGSQTSA